MAINIAPKSLDTELSELMRDVSTGKAQLPEFQRSWTWDDGRIRGIIASLSQGYPMGAMATKMSGLNIALLKASRCRVSVRII